MVSKLGIHSDIFSLGVLFHELCTGKKPLGESTEPYGEYLLENDSKMQLTSESIFFSLISSMLEPQPRKRPVIESVIDSLCKLIELRPSWPIRKKKTLEEIKPGSRVISGWPSRQLYETAPSELRTSWPKRENTAPRKTRITKKKKTRRVIGKWPSKRMYEEAASGLRPSWPKREKNNSKPRLKLKIKHKLRTWLKKIKL